MRGVLLFLVLAACAPAHRTYDAATFFETKSIRGASFSADEKHLLITTDETGIFNVYSQPVTGARRKPLTASAKNPVRAVAYFPGDDRILYTADEGGNELNHLYVREIDGRVTDLTPGKRLKARFLRWSGDDRHFFVLTNERDPKHFDLYRYFTKGYARTCVFTNEAGHAVQGVSPDGRWVALQRVNSNTDDDLFLFDTQRAKEPKHITPHKGAAAYSFATFTADGKQLWYLSNQDSEFTRAWSYDLATGEHKMEIAADWNVTSVSFSRDGRYRVHSENADARTATYLLDLETMRPLSFPVAESVRSVSVSRSGGKIAFYVDDDTSPPNLYLWNLKSRVHRRLTDALNPAIRTDDLVPSEVVRYRSFDGLQIPALLYRPKQATADNPVPALVWVHGGPGGQSRKGYRAAIQYLVNHGYAVLAVNNRGSSGYGKTFFHLDDKRHGEDDLKDCVFARPYLTGVEWVDGDRVGIIGGSYGGFMVVAALAFEPDAFEVGVDIFGVTNWLRTLQSIPPWWTSFREYLYTEIGDPVADRERLERISPLFHAKKIKKPLLVVQGANDPRVLVAESDDIVEAVRRNGVAVEYVVFPDEGHGFRNRDNRIAAAEAYRKFLDKYLKGAG